MSPTVGVDIGATAVRVVAVSGVDQDGYALVDRIGIAVLAPGAVSGGRIQNTQQVAMALTRALKEARVAPYGFVLGVASPEVAINQIRLPHAIRRNEREGAIRAMAHGGKFELSPTVPAATAVLSTHQMRTDLTGEGRQQDTVAVAGVAEGEIDVLRAVCKIARCEPRAIDLAGAAAVRALVRCMPGDNEVATIVDIGAAKTTIATRQGLNLRALRTAAGGGDMLTRSIAAVSGDSADDRDNSQVLERAESRKMLMRLTSVRNNQLVQASSYLDEEEDLFAESEMQRTAVENALTRGADQLIDTIAATIESDAHSRGGRTRGITLCGGTALLRGFKDKLEQRVAVPVLIGKPWAMPAPKSKAATVLAGPKGPDERLMLSLTTAIGLALWKEPA